MKIVLTTHQFLPEFSSGTEIITYTIARELRRRGHDVVIITGSPASTPLADDQRFDEYTYDGLRVIRFRHALVPMGGQTNLVELEFNCTLFLEFFRTFLHDFRPDIVHSVHLQRLTTAALSAVAELGIRAFFTATDFWLICPVNQLRLPDGSMCQGPRLGAANCAKHLVQMTQTTPVTQMVNSKPPERIHWEIEGARNGWLGPNDYTRYILSISARTPFIASQTRKLRRILVPSRFMEHMLIASYMPDDRMEYLPYGIETSRITRNTDRGSQPTLRIAYTGTISELKGVHILVQALRSLPADLPVELNIHGKTTDFPLFIDHLHQLIDGDPRIHFRGPYQHDDLHTILDSTDLLVCPSLWYENTPLVIYEANAAGIPVLASDLPGMAETVHPNLNGLLYPAGDSAALAAHLLALTQDRTLVKRLAEGTIIPMSIEQHVDALEKLYTQE